MFKRGFNLLELDWATLKWVGGLAFSVIAAPLTWFHYRINRLDDSKMDVKVFNQFEKRVDDNFDDLKGSQKSQDKILGKIFDKIEKKEDKVVPN